MKTTRIAISVGLAAWVAAGCEEPMGEGFWAVDVDGVVTADGVPVADVEVAGFTWDSIAPAWAFESFDDIDSTDAEGRYRLSLGTFGGGTGCDHAWAHLQVVVADGESSDTTRPAPVRVQRCIDRRSEETIDIVLDDASP